MTAEEFANAIDRMVQAIPSEIPDALMGCVPIVRAGVAENFARQGAPSMAWPQRKDIGDGHPLLDATGKLKAAATTDSEGSVARVVDGNELQVGVEAANEGSLAGALVHQYGATIRPVRKKFLSWIDSQGRRVFARQVTIPPRPYMEISEEVADECCAHIAGHFAETIL